MPTPNGNTNRLSAFDKVRFGSVGLWSATSNNAAYSEFRKRYWDDPVAFARECIHWDKGEGPTAYQNDILYHLAKDKRVCVRSLHGVGKTGLSALAIIWFALTRDGLDWKIPTTASAWRQLEKFLWPEVHKWFRRVNWERVGRPSLTNDEELSLSVRLTTGEAFALASDDHNMIEGAHADHILYVFDESKTIPEPTWDAAEGAMVSENAMWLAVSTPGPPVGRFFDIQNRKPGYADWYTRHVTLAEAIHAGRVTKAWPMPAPNSGANNPQSTRTASRASLPPPMWTP